MEQVTKTLLSLKEKIEEGEILKNRLEGEREAGIKLLMQNFGCKTLEDGEKLLQEQSKELEKKKEILKKSIQKLEERYEW